jgi:hypothetical protein
MITGTICPSSGPTCPISPAITGRKLCIVAVIVGMSGAIAPAILPMTPDTTGTAEFSSDASVFPSPPPLLPRESNIPPNACPAAALIDRNSVPANDASGPSCFSATPRIVPKSVAASDARLWNPSPDRCRKPCRPVSVSLTTFCPPVIACVKVNQYACAVLRDPPSSLPIVTASPEPDTSIP